MTATPVVDLDELERLAKAATPAHPYTPLTIDGQQAEVAFEEAATPSAILSVVSAYRALEARAVRAEKALELYGTHRGSPAGTLCYPGGCQCGLDSARAALKYVEDYSNDPHVVAKARAVLRGGE